MFFVVFTLGVLFLCGGILLYSDRKNRRLYLEQLKEGWGKPPESRYTKEQIEKLSLYGKQKSARVPSAVDGITWNDLDMDRIFTLMDRTVSAPGVEYLLYLLRTPMMEEAGIWERDRLIRMFAQDEEKRLSLQMILSQVSVSIEHPIGEGLQTLGAARTIGKNKHRLLCAAAALSLVFMFIQPVYGFFLFLGVACLNTADYYGGSDRKDVEAYLGCFRNILQMMRAAKEIERRADKSSWDGIRGYCARMRKARRALQAFQKGAYWLSGKNNISGGIEAVLADLVRMIFHVDLICYNKMLGEIQGHREDAETLMEILGEMDCAVAAASFREMLPIWCSPSFCEGMDMETEELFHPLVKTPVANSFQLERGMLLTGSNASGKSTFLKTVAVNGILAQTIATCTASYYRAPISRISTSMSLSDDLEKGDSYFMTEIRALKRILDAAEQEGPLLCMVDEVLRGTNTIERIAASSRILQSLCKDNVLCFAATHDIELTHILEGWYENYHFGEEVRDEDVAFSYILRKGRASSRNAIRLLEMMGYGEEIVRGAERAARAFEETGVWRKMVRST